LLTLLSLTTVAITIERASPTTAVLLQPYDFLHLHEVVQIGLITAFSVVVSFLILRAVSGNFEELRDRRGAVLGCLFLLGAYFYATGNGAHEVSSFLFSHFCNTQHFTSTSCGAMYADDYFFGNTVYFVGLGLSSLAVIIVELGRPGPPQTNRDLNITIANALVLALTFVAYEAFDRVLVGLISTIAFALLFGFLLFRGRARFSSVPFTFYSSLGFTLATLIAVPLRALR
jgi:hypothetical protein